MLGYLPWIPSRRTFVLVVLTESSGNSGVTKQGFIKDRENTHILQQFLSGFRGFREKLRQSSPVRAGQFLVPKWDKERSAEAEDNGGGEDQL